MTDLDELMSKDPLSLSTQDIDEIIAYQRNNRALREAGTKVSRKAKSEAPAQKIDLLALGLIKKPVAGPGIKRRI